MSQQLNHFWQAGHLVCIAVQRRRRERGMGVTLRAARTLLGVLSQAFLYFQGSIDHFSKWTSPHKMFRATEPKGEEKCMNYKTHF